ncbi:MAG: metallophosphoesterase [Chitinophagaceae bacterium]|nr:metallophosphoesterase [Chitinophagaceae bacterium]
MNKRIDLIGDIHGHADALERLLQMLGYRRKSGVYSHPQARQAVFVGDFIDRGPRIRETLHIVRDMCDAGHARAVMGNHEFNAICFHTPHTEKGGFFRDHSWKEINQHMATLEQFRHYREEWEGFLEWFRTLPIWIDDANFRVVHACWDPAHIATLSACFTGMDAEFLSRATDHQNAPPEFHAIEELLKGKEEILPDGLSFTDKDGAIRHECRIRWWTSPSERETYGDYLMECPESLRNEGLLPASRNGFSYADDKPVFFGHYWLKGSPKAVSRNAICLDYSVAKGGYLAAYSLDEARLRWVGV